MAIRVTRQFAEVMALEDPNAWVGQQFLMVLQKEVTVLEHTVNDVMSLSDEATGITGSIYESANSALSLSDGVTFTGLLSLSGSDTLNLVSTATAVRDLPVAATNAMTLTSLGGRSLTISGDNTILFSSLVAHFNYIGDRSPVGNTLTFVQDVQIADRTNIEHDLNLVQAVSVVYPYKPSVYNYLGLVSHTSTPHREFVTDSLDLTQFIPTPLAPQFITDTLTFEQDAPIGKVFDTIAFVQSVTFSFSLTAANTMNLVDSVAMTAIWVRDVEHPDFIGHALTWYEDTPCGKKQYTPFQGENTIPLNVATPSNVLRDPQGDTGNFSLYQPYLGTHTNEVVLRKPEMDNRDRNAYTRVSQETRGGKLVVFADPTWPKIRTLAVTIVGLTETQVDDLQDFMLDTVGQEIGLTDWEGRLWKGFITNPNESAIQDGKLRWTVSFQFEGEMLDVEQPGNDDGNGMAMNLSQSVTAVIV